MDVQSWAFFNHHSHHHSPHDQHLLTTLICFSPCGTLMSRAGHLPREKPGVALSVDDHKHYLIVEIDHKHHSSNHNVYDKHARAIYFCITLCTQSLPLCISKIHRSTSSEKKRVFEDLLQNGKCIISSTLQPGYDGPIYILFSFIFKN